MDHTIDAPRIRLIRFLSNGEVVRFGWEIFECVSRPHVASSSLAKDEATAIAQAREKARALGLGSDLPIERGPDGFWLYHQYDSTTSPADQR